MLLHAKDGDPVYGGDFYLLQAHLRSDGFQRVLLAIRERYREPDLSLKMLSKATNFSERHLTRLFRQHLGTTFLHYLRELRIAEAAALLTQPWYEIKAIAAIVGYTYTSRFGRDFRLLMNCTPAEFLAQHMQKQRLAVHR